jgi:hypothetical protein
MRMRVRPNRLQDHCADVHKEKISLDRETKGAMVCNSGSLQVKSAASGWSAMCANSVNSVTGKCAFSRTAGVFFRWLEARLPLYRG